MLVTHFGVENLRRLGSCNKEIGPNKSDIKKLPLVAAFKFDAHGRCASEVD